jgi:hypothetical protein
MFTKIPTSRFQAALGWRADNLTILEKLCAIVNFQAFMVAAAILAYQCQVEHRKGSWTIICIAEGFFIILAILIILNIDTKNKVLINIWSYSTCLLQLAIVVTITIEDMKQEAALASAFLIFSAVSESAAINISSVFSVFAIATVIFHDYTKEERASIGVSIVNIVITIIIRLIIRFMGIPRDNSSNLSRGFSTRTFAKSESGPSRLLSQVSNLPSGNKLVKLHVSATPDSKIATDNKIQSGLAGKFLFTS